MSMFYDILGVHLYIWEFFDIQMILNLMLTSKSFLELWLSINKLIPVSVDFKKYFISAMAPSRPSFIDDENSKAKYLINMLKIFPKIASLRIGFYGTSGLRFGVSLLFLYRDENLRSSLQNIEISINCDLALFHICDLKNLRVLTLRNCLNLSCLSMIHVSFLRKLQRFSLLGCNSIRASSFLSLSFLKELVYLNLTHCEYVEDVVLTHISGLISLRVLVLVGCSRISDNAMLSIGTDFKDLVELNISNCKRITNQGLSYLRALHKLETLDIQLCHHINDDK